MKRHFSALCVAVLLFSSCQLATSENNVTNLPPEVSASVSPLSGRDSIQAQSHASADSLLSKAIRLKEAAAFDSAIVYAEWAHEAFEALSDPTGMIQSGNTKGSALWKNGKYEEAEHHLKTVLETGRALLGEENEQVALTYNELGNTYYNQSKYGLSLKYLEKAKNIRVKIFGENHTDVAESYNNLGVLYYSQGKYSQTLTNFKRSLAIQENLLGKKHSSTGMMYHNLGALYRIIGDFELSEAMLNQALEIDISALGPSHPDVATGYENLALLFHELALYDKTEALFNTTLKIRQSSPNPSNTDISRSYHNIGLLYSTYGEYYSAEEYLLKALRLRQNHFGLNHESVASSLNNLGRIYRFTGNYDRAINVLKQSISIRNSIHNKEHPEIANSLLNLGRTYQLEGNFQLANDAYIEALGIQRKTLGSNHPSLAATHHSIGDLYLSINDPVTAKTHFQKGLDLQRKSYGETHPDLAKTYLSLGEVALKENRYQQANSFFDKGLKANLVDTTAPLSTDPPTLEKVLSTESLFALLRAKSNALHQHYLSTKNLEHLYESQRLYQNLTDLLAQHRRSFRSQASKLALNEKSVDIIEEALAVNLALYRITLDEQYIKSAFSTMEKGKATALLDAQAEADARQFSGIPDSLLSYEEDLRARLAFYDENLKKEEIKKEKADSAKIVLWRDKTFTMRKKYDALLDALENEYPDYYNLKYQNKTISIDDIRAQLLTSENALIEYFTGKDSLYTFAITDNQITVASLYRDSTLDMQIDQLRQGIILREDSLYLTSAASLFNYLIKPVSEIAASRQNWIIVPDGMLNYVPFESLLTTPVTRFTSYQHLPYLIKQHSIQYAYSSTLETTQLNIRRSVPSSGTGIKDFIAFAPVFPEGISNNTRASELITGSAIEQTREFIPEKISPATPPIPQNGAKITPLSILPRENWGHLPQSKIEVESISSLFKQRYNIWDRWFGNRSAIYLEEDAKESVVKSSVLKEHKFVHFATHGLINEAIPELSGIVMAQDTTDGEDGVLHLGEVYNLSLDAELVVLSACDTGLGKLAQGEGLIGLSRGFMYAGAKSLLVSLWKVQDGSTRYMMEFFYSNLLSDQTKTEATRNAKLSMIDYHPVFAMPYYWAGFVLIGGGDSISEVVAL